MKWPHLAAKSRMSIADALATITPALVTTTRGMPGPRALRAALYGWAFNTDHRTTTSPGPDHAAAISWIRANSLTITALDEKERRSELIRAALDTLALTMDGQPATATVIALALNAGVPAPEVATRAGHSVEVLWRVHADCIDGHEQLWNRRIDDALTTDPGNDSD